MQSKLPLLFMIVVELWLKVDKVIQRESQEDSFNVN